VSDTDTRLNRVRLNRAAMVEAREHYVSAVIDAYDAGISPTAIAMAAKVTEAAVRQTVKRNRTDG